MCLGDLGRRRSSGQHSPTGRSRVLWGQGASELQGRPGGQVLREEESVKDDGRKEAARSPPLPPPPPLLRVLQQHSPDMGPGQMPPMEGPGVAPSRGSESRECASEQMLHGGQWGPPPGVRSWPLQDLPLPLAPWPSELVAEGEPGCPRGFLGGRWQRPPHALPPTSPPWG